MQVAGCSLQGAQTRKTAGTGRVAEMTTETLGEGVVEAAEAFYDAAGGQFVFRVYGQPLPQAELILP